MLTTQNGSYVLFANGGYGKIYLSKEQNEIIKVLLRYQPENDLFECGSLSDIILSSSIGYLPNVPKIKSVNVTDLTYQMVMPYKGRTLLQCGKMSVRNACKIVWIIAQISNNLLNNGIQHTDIKPNNKLVDNHGNITLIDFSCMSIHYYDHTDGTLKWCASNGTYNFIAPEIIFTKQPENTSMVWSLGMLLCFLISDYPIVLEDKEIKQDAKQWKNIYTLLKRKDPTRLLVTKTCKQYLPKSIWSIVKQCFMYDPKKRLSLDAFMDAFHWLNIPYCPFSKIYIEFNPCSLKQSIRHACIDFIFNLCSLNHAQVILTRCLTTLDQPCSLHPSIAEDVNSFRPYCFAIMYLQASLHYVNLLNDHIWIQQLKIHNINFKQTIEPWIFSIGNVTQWNLYYPSIENTLYKEGIPFNYDILARFFKEMRSQYNTHDLITKYKSYIQYLNQSNI